MQHLGGFGRESSLGRTRIRQGNVL
jgi:hypothetical protein